MWCILRDYRQLKQEKKEIRLAIMPLLQAEEDVRYLKEVRYCLQSDHVKEPFFSNEVVSNIFLNDAESFVRSVGGRHYEGC